MAMACARAFTAAITLMAMGGALAQTPPGEVQRPSAKTGTVLSLQRSPRTLPATGDPVWQLRLIVPGQKTRSFEALVGRASRQEADRHRLGSQAPCRRDVTGSPTSARSGLRIPWNWGECSGSGWSLNSQRRGAPWGSITIPVPAWAPRVALTAASA